MPNDVYHSIHNVTLQAGDGTTQIDHVVVSVFGVFVIETKNIGGWIFGSESDAHWTQSLFGHSYKFQNPLRQNYRHVKVLSEVAEIPEPAIHSVVVFSKSCTFMTTLPENVLRGAECVGYIHSFHTPVLSDIEVSAVLARIEALRLRPSRATRRRHLDSLRSRRESLMTRRCPRCGSHMVLRTATRGANAGGRFWGCSAYPGCTMIQKFEDPT